MIEPEKFMFFDGVVKFSRDPGAMRAIVKMPDYISYLELHFPGLQILPASILLEIAAQNAGALGIVLNSLETLAVVANAKTFGVSKMVPSGSVLQVDTQIVHLGDGYTRAKCVMACDGSQVFKSDLTLKHLPWPTNAARQMVLGQLVKAFSNVTHVDFGCHMV